MNQTLRLWKDSQQLSFHNRKLHQSSTELRTIVRTVVVNMKELWSLLHIVCVLAMITVSVAPIPANALTKTRMLSDWSATPMAQTDIHTVPSNQIIVKYKVGSETIQNSGTAGLERMQVVSRAAGVPLIYQRAMSGGAHVLALPERLPDAQLAAIAERIAALTEVEYAEPDRIMFPSTTPNDPSYGSQWHYFDAYGINASVAWQTTTGSSNIRVAVLDTGKTDHPDLDSRWVGGYDFVTQVIRANDGDERDSDPHDPGNWITGAESMSGPLAGCPVTNSTWHGTHVAGTIGAASNNALGVAGINWASPIVPVRVLGKCGGFVSDIADGLRWAAGLGVTGAPANPHPAKVINMSLGGPGVCSTTYQDAIDAVNATGAIIVVAVGNGSRNLDANSHQPANCNGVIAVAATDRGGDRAIYSDYGQLVKISAPGGETFTSSPSPAPQNGVLSTLNAGLTVPAAPTYGYLQGTSMAAPHISGILSLMLSISPTLNLTQSLQILQTTAKPFPAGSACTPAPPNFVSMCGSGIVDAGAALSLLAGPATPTATNTPPPTATSTPTATNTQPPPATNTPTATDTAIPPATSTPTPTNTQPAVATNTPTATDTAVPPTATNTPLPAPTDTSTPLPTVTYTAIPPATSTPTPTNTQPAVVTNTPTATDTAVPPTATNTPLPAPTDTLTPQHTATNTATPSPTDTLAPTASPTEPPTPQPPAPQSPTPVGAVTPAPTTISVLTESGGELSANLSAQIEASIAFPPHSHSAPFTLLFEPLAVPPAMGDHFRLFGQSFVLTALDSQGQLVTSFGKPFTITIEYTDVEVADLDEQLLTLTYWHEREQRWIIIPTTLDADNNRLIAVLDHLTLFAAVENRAQATTQHRIFLPAIQSGNAVVASGEIAAQPIESTVRLPSPMERKDHFMPIPVPTPLMSVEPMATPAVISADRFQLYLPSIQR